MTVAEESTAWPKVSRPTYDGGLGFTFKWNMGWMHDTLSYFAKDPVHRRLHHNLLTFGPMYAFTENFVLPLSHDEVVHGKRSLLDKMPGDEWQRFANLRLLFTFQWTYPGKKLLFMGGEFGQPREWNHHGSLPWHLADEPRHAGIRALRARPESRLPQHAGAAPSRSRRQRLSVAVVARRRALGAELPAQGRRRACRRRAELHAGAAPRLSRRRAESGALPRDLELGLELLRRLERRQRRRR